MDINKNPILKNGLNTNLGDHVQKAMKQLQYMRSLGTDFTEIRGKFTILCKERIGNRYVVLSGEGFTRLKFIGFKGYVTTIGRYRNKIGYVVAAEDRNGYDFVIVFENEDTFKNVCLDNNGDTKDCITLDYENTVTWGYTPEIFTEIQGERVILYDHKYSDRFDKTFLIESYYEDNSIAD